MRNKIVFCQDVFPQAGGDFSGGFNSRVHNISYEESCGYPNRSTSRIRGWNEADQMIKTGQLYYQGYFKHLSDGKICKAKSFSYGGLNCHTCGKRGVIESWWNIKVMKDGSQWCVIGEGFENLQESDNYAFGATKEEALQNYQNINLAADALDNLKAYSNHTRR